MKLITAVIQPHALERVMDSLRQHGIQGLTITEVVGSGSQGGHAEVYRGASTPSQRSSWRPSSMTWTSCG